MRLRMLQSQGVIGGKTMRFHRKRSKETKEKSQSKESYHSNAYMDHKATQIVLHHQKSSKFVSA